MRKRLRKKKDKQAIKWNRKQPLLYNPGNDTLWLSGEPHHVDYSAKIWNVNQDGTIKGIEEHT